MDRRAHRRRRVALAAMGLTAVLVAGGCGAADSGDEATSAGAPAADSANEGAADRGAAGAGAPTEGGTGSPDLRVDQRSIIYTGTMLIRVDDVDGASRRAIETVTTAGGFVGGDERTSAAADARSELQLRVPAARFTAVIDELAKLGRQERREIHTEDVTEETVDLDARIATQRARVENSRRLLARATTISELVSLEGELAKREADLASLEAKKRRLADLTALSTITLTLVGQDVTTAEKETELGFLVGLSNGWKVFLISMTIMLTVLGAVLPWLIAFGVPLTVLIVALRRRRRRRPAPPVSAPPPPVPAARSAP